MTEEASRVWTVPNIISVVRLAGVPLFLWLVLGPEADALALVVLMVAGFTDYLDGWLARRLDQFSKLGEILDPVADRLYILAVVIGLYLRDIIPWWVALALPLRDLLPLGTGAVPAHPRLLRAARCTSSARPRPSTCSTPSRCCCSARATASSPNLARTFGWALRVVGDRALLVGRRALRLAGPHAAAGDPQPYVVRDRPWLTHRRAAALPSTSPPRC